MPSNRAKTASLLATIYGVLGVYIVLLVFVEPVQQAIAEFMTFFKSFPASLATLWVFVFMVIGNSSNIPVGIAAVFFFAKGIATGPFFWPELVLFSLSAGFGAGTGQIAIYAIGRGAGAVLKDRKSVKNLEYLAKLMTHRRSLTPLLVYLFGLTPLPDQLIVVPLGIVKYPLKKMYLPCSLGKGTFAFFIAIGSALFNLSGPDSPTVQSMVVEACFLAILLTAIVFLVMIDWEGIFTRHARKALGEPPVDDRGEATA